MTTRVFRSEQFKCWYSKLSGKDKRIVDARVDLARSFGVLSNYKQLDKDYSLYEFKWNSGLRVYFALLNDRAGRFILLLIGGNKNTQERDIMNSKNIIRKANISLSRKGKSDE